MEHFSVDGAVIEYQVHGTGEPVLLISGFVADGLGRPLLGQPELASRYQVINYHRRGYMGSTAGQEPPTAERQAADAAALLKHIGVNRAHIAGYSIGGLLALQLVADSPQLVHSLALLDPLLGMVPSGKASLEQSIMPMLNAYRAGNKRQAVNLFCDYVFGPNWQSIVENAVPGGIEQSIADLDTFVRDMQAIQGWSFGPEAAAAVRQPVLSVLGATGHQFMKEVRQLLHAWFSQTEDYDEPTTHLLQLQDPKGVAHGLAAFFARHPMA